MRPSLFAAALAGVALVSAPIQARAQMSSVVKPVQFGVALGGAIPMSDLSNVVNTGFNGTLTVGFNPAMIPLGIRVDGAYNQFAFKGGGANTHFTSVTGNLLFKVPSQSINPYLIGGAGLYNSVVADNTGNSVSENDFGWNLGAGISMPLSGFDTFLEARYNQVQVNGGSLKFIPITFGIMF